MASKRLSELCTVLTTHGFPARLEGEDRHVSAVNTLEEAGATDLTFLANPKYLACLPNTRAAAVVLKDDVPLPSGISAIRSPDPYAAVTVAIITLHGHRRHPQWGKDSRADIHPSASIGAEPNIAPGVSIAANAVIGDRCTLYPGCYIGQDVRLGHDCILYPNVVIYDYCELGNRVTIHAGSVVGEDGLGYAPVGEKWVKIPQVGRAVLGDDVEIGANCAIDRATLGRTEIGAGTKFGNVVVIGHGTRVGPDCLFVGLVGVAGSVNIGRHVTLAGQVGVAGHLTIGDHVRAGGQAGITGNVPPNIEILGSPAVPIDDAKRSVLHVLKLSKWIERIKALEREVAELKEGRPSGEAGHDRGRRRRG